jgi:hypothetical protein
MKRNYHVLSRSGNDPDWDGCFNMTKKEAENLFLRYRNDSSQILLIKGKIVKEFEIS